MAALTSEELALLRSGAQRFRCYFTRWGLWEIMQSTPFLINPITGNPITSNILITPGDLMPVLNIGSHRLGFVGEPLTFDASRSWHYDGSGVSGGEWDFAGGTPPIATGVGPHSVVWHSPGDYQVFYINGDAQATRWVRIEQNRMSLPYEVVSIGGVAGGIDGGWRADITIAPNDVNGLPINLMDFQAVGLFVEDEWWNGSQWVRRPIGGYQPEPRLLISGYVQQGSIRSDANTHNVSFSIGSLADQMRAITIHATHNWNSTFNVPTETSGTIYDGFSKVTTPLIILTLLQIYTNVLPYHDFSTWSDSSLQNMAQLSNNETTLWSALSGWAEPEFAWLFVDQGNGLHLKPNPHIRSAAAFNALYPIRATLVDTDLLDITVNERLHRNVIWAQITGTNVWKGKPIVARYPGITPPSGPGSWLVKDGLFINSQSYANAIVANLYNDANRRFEFSLTQPLNRAIGVPERIRVTLALPDRGINWVNKHFVVEQVNYQIDVAQSTWRTTITAKEVL